MDLPKFEGDPLKWRQFRTLFSTAIKTRADEFSELDKRALLGKSLLNTQVKDMLHNAPDSATLEELLAELQQRFGRPVVVPLLIKKTHLLDVL